MLRASYIAETLSFLKNDLQVVSLKTPFFIKRCNISIPNCCEIQSDTAMNVSKSTQLELALLLKTLKVIKSCPGLSISMFFDEMLPILKGVDERSLSAHWKEKYKEKEKNLTSLVSLSSVGEAESKDEPIVGIKELEYLKEPKHVDMKHDPMLVVRTIYNTALGSLASSSLEERAVLLIACFMIAVKSARASLLLNTAMLSYLLRDEIISLETDIFAGLYEYCVEAASRDPAKNLAATLNKQSVKMRSPDASDDDTIFVLSFGKADHGKYIQMHY